MRIPGIDIDFSTELQTVRFREHVSPIGMGQAVGYLAADGITKLFADSAMRFVCAVKITSAEKQQAEYTLIPIDNVAFLRPKPPVPLAQRPAKRTEAAVPV